VPTYQLLAPHIPLPSTGASETQLPREEIKRRMRTYLEMVAASGWFVYHSYLTLGFAKKGKRSEPHYPDIDSVRDEALQEFNQDDAKAGRPLVTAVLLDAKQEEMLPRKHFFEALERLKGIEVTNANAKALHLQELLAARQYPWSCKEK
jgi:hypothetical protein